LKKEIVMADPQQGFDSVGYMNRQNALRGGADTPSGQVVGDMSKMYETQSLGTPMANAVAALDKMTGIHKTHSLADVGSKHTYGWIGGGQPIEGLLATKYIGPLGALSQILSQHIVRDIPDHLGGVQANPVDTNVQISGSPFDGVAIADAGSNGAIVGPPRGFEGGGRGGNGFELG
jgi:hypothetical protein